MPAPDPRHTVTPDAFHVDPALLGAPLATPKRRLAALLIDLTLATVIGELGGVLIGLAVAVVFFLAATRRREQRILKRWARGGLALAGALALFVTAVAVIDGADEAEDAAAEHAALEALEGELAADPSSAVALREAEAWLAFVPADVRRTMQTSVAAAPEASVVDTAAAAALLHAYADALAARDRAALDTLDAEAVVAGPTIARLHARADVLAERVDRLEDANAALEEAAANPGLGRLLRTLLADFGLTAGWVGIYLTLFIAYWNGRTPGKRLLGLRAVRLDGRPITLWNAFERFGGLAAGVATGLLGFAQVYWDANRQGIHDKIASTVVVRERTGWGVTKGPRQGGGPAAAPTPGA